MIGRVYDFGDNVGDLPMKPDAPVTKTDLL
jgi:hypothetical protein